jgi:hypothetical protein
MLQSSVLEWLLPGLRSTHVVFSTAYKHRDANSCKLSKQSGLSAEIYVLGASTQFLRGLRDSLDKMSLAEPR